MRTWNFPELQPKAVGPWASEPDKAQWVDEATGLDCLILRNRLGALCGYVGVPREHPAYGLDYDAVHALAEIEVHGGLTYGDKCMEVEEGKPGICHVPEPGRPENVWWIGFDCAHAWDLVPGMDEVRALAGISRYSGPVEVYRDFAYVQAEVTSLAAQLAAVKR